MLGGLRNIGSSGRRRKGRSLNLSAQQWLIALLIGLATVTAALFGWRAAAIGSTAAFDDRQSISETIKVQQETLDVALTVVDETRQYSRYLADYALAAELDNQADALEGAGDEDNAAQTRERAQDLRRSATESAADAGVFGAFSIADDVREPSATPRPFSLDERARAVAAEEATGIDSPGQLDPSGWALQAEEIRDRIQGLVVWAFVLLASVLLFTTAQVFSDRRPVFYSFLGLGIVVLLFGMVSGFTIDFVA